MPSQWPYFHSVHIMQSNGGLRTILIKSTVFQSPAWENKTSASQLKNEAAKKDIQALQVSGPNDSSPALSSGWIILNHKINQSSIQRGGNSITVVAG